MPKIGTLLCFGDTPSKSFPHSKIQAIKFNGLDITSPIASRQILEGTLPELINSARTFIESLTGKGSLYEREKLTRTDLTEYPFFVLREAIANSVAHRDYSETGREIDIQIFDDRIEVISPGGLGGGLTISDLGTGKRYIRNHLIADILNDLRFIERAGTGIARIIREMKSNGSPDPIFKSDTNTFIAILPSHPFYSARRLVEQANDEKSRSNYSIASQLYGRALELDPTNYNALTSWADLELKLGNRENCRSLLRKAIDIDRNNPSAWLSLAFLEERLNNISAAREVYKAAIKYVTNSSVVYRSWAILEWNQKKYKHADDLFKEAIRIDPKDFMNLYKRGQMNINSPVLKVKRLGEADLRRALNLTADSYIISDIYFLLARSMESLNYSQMEIDEAFQKAIHHNPGRLTILHHYGDFLKRIGKEKEGEDYIKKAAERGYIPKSKKRRKKN